MGFNIKVSIVGCIKSMPRNHLATLWSSREGSEHAGAIKTNYATMQGFGSVSFQGYTFCALQQHIL